MIKIIIYTHNNLRTITERETQEEANIFIKTAKNIGYWSTLPDTKCVLYILPQAIKKIEII